MYKAPAHTYLRPGPTYQPAREGRHGEVIPGGWPTPRVARPRVGSIWPKLWREDHPYPPKGGAQCFHIDGWQEPTYPSYKGRRGKASQDTTSEDTTWRREDVGGLHL